MFVCLFISLLIASQTNKQIKKVMAQSIAFYSINAAECWLRELRVCPIWLETHMYDSILCTFFHLILLFLLFLRQTKICNNMVTPSHPAWLHKSVKCWRYNTHAHAKYLLLCALCIACSTNSRTDELILKYHHANLESLISCCHCCQWWCLFVCLLFSSLHFFIIAQCPRVWMVKYELRCAWVNSRIKLHHFATDILQSCRQCHLPFGIFDTFLGCSFLFT